MKQEIQARLDQVFEKKNRVDTATAQAKSAQEQKEEDAVRKFKALMESVIKPTMQQFGDYLSAKGHPVEIFAEDEKIEGSYPNQRPREAFVELRFSSDSQLPPRYSVNQGPHFNVYLDKAHSKVWFQESTMTPTRGGHAGKCGEADLDKLTSELLEPFIAKTIESVFG